MPEEDAETLGEREARGFIDADFAAELEETHGPDWRKMTHREAIAISVNAIAAAEAGEAQARRRKRDARTRIEINQALLRRAEAGDELSDAVIGDVMRELYGDAPTSRQTDQLLIALADVQRALRGEPRVEPEDSEL